VRFGRRARPVATFVLSLAFLAILAQPAWAGIVAPGGSDAGNDCSVQEDPCATIQHAIDEAQSGETVDVRAGVYDEDLTIDKPLMLRGPGIAFRRGEPEAVVEGDGGTTIKAESNGITIEGMTVTSTGTGTAIRSAGADADQLVVEQDIVSGGSTGVRLEAGGEEDRIGYNVIEDVGEGIQLNGDTYSKLEIRWNQFVAPISEYTVLAGSGTAIEELRLEGNEMPAPARLASRITAGPWGESLVAENSFDSTTGPQLTIDGARMSISDNSFEGHGTAGCLQILGNQTGLAPSSEMRVYSKNEFIGCDPYGVELGPEVDEISIFENDFGGSYDGILTSDASTWDVTGRVVAPWNRFVGTTHLAVDNTALGTLDAKQNWWGCNAGPGGQGCDRVSAGVDAANNAKLVGWIGPRKPETGILETPPDRSITLNPGEQAEIWAVLTVDGRESITGVPTEKTPVGFSSPTGRLSQSSSRLSNGWTAAYFTAGTTPGPGYITLSMDNQQTRVPVTVTGEVKTPITTPPSSAPATESTTPSQPSARPETPSAPVFRSAGRRSRLKAGHALVGSVSCADACRVASSRIQITIGRRHFRATLSPRGTFVAGASTSLQIGLPNPALQALKKDGSGRIKGTITVVDSAGQKTTRAISTTVSL
jgi:hypothetical protein